jgi:alpha-galactosidase
MTTNPQSVRKPKLVVIGAGTIFFTRAVVIGMCKYPSFRGATLSLVDLNEDQLDVMTGLCHRIIQETGADLQVESTTDRRKALKGADFVVLCFGIKGVDLRETDSKISTRYGVIQSCADSISAGGLFRSIRTVPAVLEVARDIEKICPNAWVLNYNNPTTVMGAALSRCTKLKNLALCDGVILPDTKLRMMNWVGVPAERADDVVMKMAGINHFSWLTEFRLGKKDLLPKMLELLRKKPELYGLAHSINNSTVSAVAKILEVYGWCSMIGGHMVEFLPYFQGRGSNPGESHTCQVWAVHERRKWLKSFNEEIRKQVAGEAPVDKLIATTPTDLTVRIADSVLRNAGEVQFVNIPNRGYIANLPKDAVVEVCARIYQDHYKAEVFGEMPPVLRSWLLRVVDVQELTLEAALTGSRRALRQALVADPLTVSIEDAEHIIDDLLEAERDDLPPVWRDGGKP